MAHEELSPLNITPGAIRFNTDSMKLEYFRIMEGGSWFLCWYWNSCSRRMGSDHN